MERIKTEEKNYIFLTLITNFFKIINNDERESGGQWQCQRLVKWWNDNYSMKSIV